MTCTLKNTASYAGLEYSALSIVFQHVGRVEGSSALRCAIATAVHAKLEPGSTAVCMTTSRNRHGMLLAFSDCLPGTTRWLRAVQVHAATWHRQGSGTDMHACHCNLSFLDCAVRGWLLVRRANLTSIKRSSLLSCPYYEFLTPRRQIHAMPLHVREPQSSQTADTTHQSSTDHNQGGFNKPNDPRSPRVAYVEDASDDSSAGHNQSSTPQPDGRSESAWRGASWSPYHTPRVITGSPPLQHPAPVRKYGNDIEDDINFPRWVEGDSGVGSKGPANGQYSRGPHNLNDTPPWPTNGRKVPLLKSWERLESGLHQRFPPTFHDFDPEGPVRVATPGDFGSPLRRPHGMPCLRIRKTPTLLSESMYQARTRSGTPNKRTLDQTSVYEGDNITLAAMKANDQRGLCFEITTDKDPQKLAPYTDVLQIGTEGVEVSVWTEPKSYPSERTTCDLVTVKALEHGPDESGILRTSLSRENGTPRTDTVAEPQLRWL